jgi:hypothetical protein
VPNGFDPEDFAGAPASRNAEELLVVHSGAFRASPPGRPRTGVRAWVDRRAVAPVPYDLSTHSPETLLRAMAAVGRGAAKPIRARLVGPLDPRWIDLAKSLGVAGQVETLGYRPHREATAHVVAADVLYLPTVTRLDGASVSNVPAKTYEYLGSGRPVAALAGPGDVRDLVEGRARVELLGPRDVEGLAETLVRCADGRGPVAAEVSPDDVRDLRRDELAARMAQVLRSASGAQAPVEAPEGR